MLIAKPKKRLPAPIPLMLQQLQNEVVETEISIYCHTPDEAEALQRYLFSFSSINLHWSGGNFAHRKILRVRDSSDFIMEYPLYFKIIKVRGNSHEYRLMYNDRNSNYARIKYTFDFCEYFDIEKKEDIETDADS